MSKIGIIILLVTLLLSMVCYIIARIRMSKEKLVLTAGRMDVTFVMISPLFAIIGWLFFETMPSLYIVTWALWTIAIIGFALSIMYSIIENKESGWDIAWSIGAKVFIFITTIFIIIVSIIGLLVYMVYYLIKQLAKSDDEEDESHGGLALPHYRKFMNAYVGAKPFKKAPKVKIENIEAEEVEEKK